MASFAFSSQVLNLRYTFTSSTAYFSLFRCLWSTQIIFAVSVMPIKQLLLFLLLQICSSMMNELMEFCIFLWHTLNDIELILAVKAFTIYFFYFAIILFMLIPVLLRSKTAAVFMLWLLLGGYSDHNGHCTRWFWTHADCWWLGVGSVSLLSSSSFCSWASTALAVMGSYCYFLPEQ